MVGGVLPQARRRTGTFLASSNAARREPLSRHPDRKPVIGCQQGAIFAALSISYSPARRGGVKLRGKIMEAENRTVASQRATQAANHTNLHSGRGAATFPMLRWIALVWLAVWIPVYWRAWGWQNFFHFCDIAVILSCIGIFGGNRLLISSQTVAAIVPQAIWCFEVCWRAASGRNFFGGAEYMWDASVPRYVRWLSLFHVVLPLVLLYAVWRVRYDRRGFPLQIAIAALTLAISRALGPALNLNYAFVEPLFHRTWGPAPVHLMAVLAFISLIFYLPVHVALCKWFR